MAKTEKAKNWDDLETFKSVGGRLDQGWVTVSERGSLVLSVGFAHTAKLRDQFTHAILSYSGANNAIVVEFTADADAAGALKLTKGGNYVTITGTSFWEYFGLNLKNFLGRYIPTKMKIPKRGSVWVISLNEKVEPTS